MVIELHPKQKLAPHHYALLLSRPAIHIACQHGPFRQPHPMLIQIRHSFALLIGISTLVPFQNPSQYHYHSYDFGSHKGSDAASLPPSPDLVTLVTIHRPSSPTLTLPNIPLCLLSHYRFRFEAKVESAATGDSDEAEGRGSGEERGYV